MLTSIIEFSLRQRLMVVICACGLLFFGAYSFLTIPIDAFPDISSTQVKVILKAPGMAPEEVENRVVRPLELELLGLPNQKSLRSLSKYGLADITIDFNDGTDIYLARNMVNEKLIDRGIRIVSEIAKIPYDKAAEYIQSSDHNVKTACVMAIKKITKEEAEKLLQQNNGILRKVI